MRNRAASPPSIRPAKHIISSSSEQVYVFEPTGWKRNGSRRAIIACHAAGGTAASAGGYDGHLLAQMTGCLVMYPDLSTGHSWGNAASVTKVGDHWTTAKNSFGAKTDKVILFGGSMGGCTAVVWAGQNPASVAAIGLVIPVLNTLDIRNNNRGGHAANINAAFGSAAAFDTAEPTQNPFRHFATLTSNSIPVVMYPNELDSICLVTYARALRDSGNPNVSYNEVLGIDHFPANDDSLYSRLAAYR